ncbi:MAG: hypothetical protein HY362_02270 [Candidatus Aenigmarchaeota archaeon]|nr:hypothetical protein [Candidatus Aenigmarchaeota archaeon]
MKITEDFAYFLGIIAGDGYVGDRTIEVKTSDYKFLRDVYVPLIERLFNKTPSLIPESSGIKAFRAYFGSKELCKILEMMRLKSPKTFTVSMPDEIIGKIKLEIAFTRGVFDTDGSVHSRKNRNYPTINLDSRSTNLIHSLEAVVNSLGMKGRVTKSMNNGKPLYYLRLYGFGQLARFSSTIGFLNPYKAKKAIGFLKNHHRARGLAE